MFLAVSYTDAASRRFVVVVLPFIRYVPHVAKTNL